MKNGVPHAPGLAHSTISGYLHPSYAGALAEFGSPLKLPSCQGWVLQRRITNSSYADVMGCYPLFSCVDWSQLHADIDDLADLAESIVSIAVVTDPFGEYDVAYLKQCFGDIVLPFKQHFVVDLSKPVDTFVNAHHRRNARKARQDVQVEECPNPLSLLEEWNGLYKGLVERHAMKGLAVFSRESFAKQLTVPGIVAFRALSHGSNVGMLLWYRQGEIAYYHLGAYSERGYDLRASFALFSHAIEFFAQQGLRWLNLGGAAGAGEGQSAGLSRFKEGWSTGVRTAYFCGRIIDPLKYGELVRARNLGETEYFPAYRFGEFV